MGGIDNIESYSYNDLSLIQVELLTTVKDDEVEQYWDLLRRKVEDVRKYVARRSLRTDSKR